MEVVVGKYFDLIMSGRPPVKEVEVPTEKPKKMGRPPKNGERAQTEAEKKAAYPARKKAMS